MDNSSHKPAPSLVMQTFVCATTLAILIAGCISAPTQQPTDQPTVSAANTNVAGPATQTQPEVDPCADPLQQPEATTLAAATPDQFAWILFLYLNCPASSDPANRLVWETWKSTDLVYLPNGAPPDPWSAPLPPIPTLFAEPEISGYDLADNAGQPALYEIRMNEAAFQYIVDRSLYSKQGQLDFFNAPASSKEGAPIVFPSAAIEVKAVWLILSAGDPRASRYYVRQAQYVDANGQTQTVTVGLSGLHIASKIVPNWFWVTFEQADNQQVTPAPATQPIPPQTQALNDQIHAQLPVDSPWQYYNLRGSQLAFVDVNNAPTLLSNTLIETDFQNSSSCITCHALASRGAETQGRLAFFNNTDAGIQGYVGNLDDPANVFYDAFDNPVCFNANLFAFSACDDPSQVVYKQMDFVWSLREAK